MSRSRTTKYERLSRFGRVRKRHRRLLCEWLEPRQLLASVAGMVFNDLNQNGVFESAANETAIAGRTIYLDLNNNGRFEPTAEPSQVTGVDGKYRFAELGAGHYEIGLIESAEWAQVSPAQPSPRVRQISLAANDIVFDAVSGLIYASVPSSAGTIGNSVTTIDPVAGTVGSSVFVGSEPGKLAASDNGEFLYVALNGAAAVRRVTLSSLTAGLQFSPGGNSFDGPFYAADLDVMPGNSHAVAISRANGRFSPSHEGVAIYDDGVARTVTTPDHTGSNVIEFSASGSVLYGYNTESTEFGFRRMSVTSSAVTITDVTRNLISGFGSDIEFDGGRIYATSGAVVDPEAKTLVGTFSASGVLEPDSQRGVTYFMAGSQLQAFDQQTFRLISSLSIPGFAGTAVAIIRWGNGGLAIRTDQGKVFLVEWDPRVARLQVDVAINQALEGLDFGNRLLAAPGIIRGQVFNDADGSGSKNGAEGGLAGRQVFLDQNGNSQLDASEQTALTDAGGNYAFSGLPPGSYIVAQVPPANVQLTAPAATEARVRVIDLPANDIGERHCLRLGGRQTVCFDACQRRRSWKHRHGRRSSNGERWSVRIRWQ
jgi:hypothetical protein